MTAPVVSSLPDLPAGSSTDQIIDWLQKLKTQLTTREPLSAGSALNKFVTRGELVGFDVLQYSSDGKVSVGTGSGFTLAGGGGSGGSTDLTPPTPINGLTVTAGLSYFFVEFDAPSYTQGGGNAFTQIYAANYSGTGPLPTFADAVPIDEVIGANTIAAIPAQPGQESHFWAGAVSVAGVRQVDGAGPTGGTHGVSATTGQDVTSLLGALTAAAEDPASPYSKIAFRADMFYIGNAAGTFDGVPFYVTTTTITQNGVTVPPGVYMQNAFIANGTITNAMIGSLAVDNAKIANLSAAKLTAGSVAVGETIQSTGYVPGSAGWKISGNGTAEFGFASIRGTLQAGQVAANYVTASMIDSRGLSIKDASGNVILSAGVPLDYTRVVNAPQSTGNLIIRSTFEDQAIGSWAGNTGVSIAAISVEAGAPPFAYCMRVTYRDNYEGSNPIPVVAGETIYVAGWIYGHPSDAVSVGMAFQDNTGTYVNWVPGITHGAGAGWAYITGSLVVPTGAVRAFPWIQINGTGGTNLGGLAAVVAPYLGRSQPGANATYIDSSGNIQNVLTGGGTPVANSLMDPVIADKLSKTSNSVLAATVSINATAGAGFVAGNLTWDAAGARLGGSGVAMTPGGLAGYNTAGAPTFTIDATTGNAYFAGELKSGISSAGTTSGSVATSGGNASATSAIFAGATALTFTTTGKDVLLLMNVTVGIQTNTDISVRASIIPKLDGVTYSPTGHNFEQQLREQNTRIAFTGGGATVYNWGVTTNFQLAFVIPGSAVPAGSHTFGFLASALFYDNTGTAANITGSSIYTEAIASVREFLA